LVAALGVGRVTWLEGMFLLADAVKVGKVPYVVVNGHYGRAFLICEKLPNSVAWHL